MRKQSTISLDVSSDTNSTSSENTFTQRRYSEKQFKGKGTKVRVGELEAMVEVLKRAVEQRMEMMKTLEKEVKMMESVVVEFRMVKGVEDDDKDDEKEEEILEKNLVFHGIKKDWIEEEIDDDIDLKKHFLEHKLKVMMKQQMGIDKVLFMEEVFR